ncbi:DUF4382 domain-containing protein [Shewanella sp. A25]|nr:DUF4382 domain-containing protein [Shewanella shenzhenensis]
MNTSSTAIAAIFTLALTGCNDSTSFPEHVDIAGQKPVTYIQPTFFLGVSDNPAEVESVTVAFKQVVLKSTTNTYSFELSSDGGYKLVNLMDFQGSAVENLVNDQPISAGQYQVCIYIQNSLEPNTNSSHVKTKDGAIYGLIINGEDICGGSSANDSDTGALSFTEKMSIHELPSDYVYNPNRLVVDFELNTGLVEPQAGQTNWEIKLSSIMLDYASTFSSISGAVSDAVMAECEAAAGGSNFVHMVYVYPFNTSLSQMRDFRPEANSVDNIMPITAGRVVEVVDSNGVVTGHEYVVDIHLPYGYDYDYRALGYTCLAQNDDPNAANNPTDSQAPFYIFTDYKDGVLVPQSDDFRADFI